MLHRDDIDQDLIKILEDQVKQEFGDKMKIVFPGDLPEDEMPEEVKQAMAEIDRRHEASLRHGMCFQCGLVMPGYPAKPEDVTANWEPEEKWGYLIDIRTGAITAWTCPTCGGGKDGLSTAMIPFKPKKQGYDDGYGD